MNPGSHHCYRTALLLLCAIVSASVFCGDAKDRVEPNIPFRTDYANAHLPWYQPKPLEFPPHHSDRRIGGSLVQADFLHRTGQFRTRTGELMDFAMPPYGTVSYLNTEADLRDVPLGTFFLFFLNQDTSGNFTRLATMQDQFTMDAGHGFNYRLDEIKLAENTLNVSKQAPAKKELNIEKKSLKFDARTRIVKAGKTAQLSDLAVGDELLFSFTYDSATHTPLVTDIWVGTDSQKLATDTQTKVHSDFLKARGLPAWIEKTEGKTLTLVFFASDPKYFKDRWAGDFARDRDIGVCVANDELRTWNPPVDQEHTKIAEVLPGPMDCYGSSGVRVKCTMRFMLEGFRAGCVVRLFGPGWNAQDMPFGEGIYSPLQTAEINLNIAKEFPAQFPFRTDYCNADLPWYQLKPTEVPPLFSDHNVLGDLIKIDAEKRTGQFRVERSELLVDFSVIQQGGMVQLNTNKVDDGGPARFNEVTLQAMLLGAASPLADLPLNQRYHFHLYQDEKGAFTKVSLLTDEFSYMMQNKVVVRVDELRLDKGELFVGRQIPKKQNFKGEMVQPPDIGRAILRVGDDTRVWKGEAAAKLTDLAVGDVLVFNVTSEQKDKPAHCTDIWIGADTHQSVVATQQKKNPVKKP